MSFAVLAILLPGVAAVVLLFLGSPGRAAGVSLASNSLVFCFTCAAFGAPGTGMVHADPAGLLFGCVSSFAWVTTAWANLSLVRQRPASLTPRGWRVYHALGQILFAATLLGLYADSLGLLWLAAEIAAIAGIICVRLPGTQAALQAARYAAAAAAAGLALAAFGTLLVYAAAAPVLAGADALSWLALAPRAAMMNGTVLTLGFVLALAGYGGLMLLAPFNAWVAGRAMGPATPLTAGLAGLSRNIGLLAILRFQHLLQGNFRGGGGMAPEPIMLAAGLAVLLASTLRLLARADAPRLLTIAGIGQSGLALFAFGLGGAAAIFGGLLTMALASLLGAAMMQNWMLASAGGGADAVTPGDTPGWIFAAGVLTAMALPPSGLFSGAFIIIGQAVSRQPRLAPVLVLALAAAALALGRRLPRRLPRRLRGLPVAAGLGGAAPVLQLALILLAGFAMPPPLVHLLSAAAAALS